LPRLRWCAERFPNTNNPKKAAFEKLLTQFKKIGRKPLTENEDIELAVIAEVVEHPQIGPTKIAQNHNISQACF